MAGGITAAGKNTTVVAADRVPSALMLNTHNRWVPARAGVNGMVAVPSAVARTTRTGC